MREMKGTLWGVIEYYMWFTNKIWNSLYVVIPCKHHSQMTTKKFAMVSDCCSEITFSMSILINWG